jgi:hypothetical protein
LVARLLGSIELGAGGDVPGLATTEQAIERPIGIPDRYHRPQRRRMSQTRRAWFLYMIPFDQWAVAIERATSAALMPSKARLYPTPSSMMRLSFWVNAIRV